MYYALIVAFIIDGEVKFNSNLLPSFFNTYEECETVRLSVEPKIALGSPYPYHLSCYRMEAKGSNM